MEIEQIFKTTNSGKFLYIGELVRCKDCKHCYVEFGNVQFNVCELDHNEVQSGDWFCADGERKEG